MRTFETMEDALDCSRGEDKVMEARVESESWKYWKVYPWGLKQAISPPRKEKE